MSIFYRISNGINFQMKYFIALPPNYLAAISFSSSVFGFGLKLGMLYPWDCNSAIAAVNWGILADTFGSLIMFASGVLANSPSSASSSACLWDSVRFSGKWAIIRPLTDISFRTTET